MPDTCKSSGLLALNNNYYTMKRVASLLDVRNLTATAFAAILLWSCSNSGNGELVGAQNRQKMGPQVPFGMVYVPGGSFVLGAGGFDPSYKIQNMRNLSMRDFFME